MLECAREVLAVTGSRSEISFEPLPEDDPARRRPDITKAKSLLGWEPKVELREGLERSLEYFRGCVAGGGLSEGYIPHGPLVIHYSDNLDSPTR